jgi:glycosyltransferase involved in cell wall biosynthesis
MNKIRISVVICTKDRVKYLEQCLSSLLRQTLVLDELIIIDNNSSDKTAGLVKVFAKKSPFPTHRIIEKREGYPILYNRGLHEAHFSWVSFIDDDCIPSSTWFSALHKAIRAHSDAAAILGNTDTVKKNNIWSLCSDFNMKYWKMNGINGDAVTDFEVLDNKNIVYNNIFLRKSRIGFDVSIIPYCNGAGEDMDLGMQIQKAKGKAYYCKDMKALHTDPSTFWAFSKKCVRSALSYEVYRTKWERFRLKYIIKNNRAPVSVCMQSYAKEQKMSVFITVRFMAILYTFYGIGHFLSFWYRSNLIFRKKI